MSEYTLFKGMRRKQDSEQSIVIPSVRISSSYQLALPKEKHQDLSSNRFPVNHFVGPTERTKHCDCIRAKTRKSLAKFITRTMDCRNSPPRVASRIREKNKCASSPYKWLSLPRKSPDGAQGSCSVDLRRQHRKHHMSLQIRSTLEKICIKKLFD